MCELLADRQTDRWSVGEGDREIRVQKRIHKKLKKGYPKKDETFQTTVLDSTHCKNNKSIAKKTCDIQI